MVIYQENHSFDNLYGRWEGVNGLRDAPRARTTRSTRPARPTSACSRNDVTCPDKLFPFHHKPVSFIKPVGAENEHPGYASVTAGSSHLIDRRFDLAPLSDRDAAVRDLSSVFHASRPRRP